MTAFGLVVISVVVSCFSWVSGSFHGPHTPPKTKISACAGATVQGIPFFSPGCFGHSYQTLNATRDRLSRKGLLYSLLLAILSSRALKVLHSLMNFLLGAFGGMKPQM